MKKGWLWGRTLLVALSIIFIIAFITSQVSAILVSGSGSSFSEVSDGQICGKPCPKTNFANVRICCDYGERPTCVQGSGPECLEDPNKKLCSFTYSSWSACTDGQQTRTITGSSPSGCNYGYADLSQSCTAPTVSSCCNLNAWTTAGECSGSPLSSWTRIIWHPYVGGVSGCDDAYCKANTKTTQQNDPNLNDECNTKAGIGTDLNNGQSCPYGAAQCKSGYCDPSGKCANVPPVQCSSWSYGSWSACSNGVKTRTATGSPSGCAGTAPSSETSATCTGGNGDSCTSALHCSSGYCSPQGKCDNPPLKNDGESCSANNQCKSGFCNSGKCATPQNWCTGGWTCTSWSACYNGVKTCTAATGSVPSGCTGESPYGNPTYLTMTSTSGCTQPTHSVCSNYACTSVAGAGTNECSADYFCKKSDGSSCSSSNECQSGQCSWSWSRFKFVCGVGDSQPEPVCTGAIPSNANLCSGDDSSLSQDTTRTVVSTCTDSRKCEYTCASGFEYDSGQCVPITAKVTSASWADMSGSAISTADLNDRIVMNAYGGHLSGTSITFSWYKSGSSNALGSASVTAQSDSYASYNTTINSSGAVYFKATALGNTITSSDLNVLSTKSNSPPIVSISSPTQGSIYFSGANISFAQASRDVDSNIQSIVWNFGDGSSSSQSNPTHIYRSAGEKSISLVVTDEHGASSSQNLSILIADENSYSSFANIRSPSDSAVIVSNNLAVPYDGRGSYVIRTSISGSPCTVSVQCMQGECPAQTSSSPSCASNPKAAVPITGSPASYSQTSFTWAFKDSNAYLSPDSGMGKVSGTKGFSDYGIKVITLTVSYTNGSKAYNASVSRTLTLFNQRQCSSSGTTWYKISNGFITESRDTLSTTACAGLDLQVGTNDDCCPLGFTCSTSGTPGCKLDESADKGCSSYTAQQACAADSSQRARNELLWDFYKCGSSDSGNNVLCSCSWNSQRSLCEFGKSLRPENNPVNGTMSACSYSTSAGQCSNGYQNVQITASGNSQLDPLCSDSTQILPCGRPVVALPFFEAWQAIIAVLAIAAAYGAYARMRRPSKKSCRR